MTWLILLLGFNLLSAVASRYDLYDLGPLLHSVKAYDLGLNPYEEHEGITPRVYVGAINLNPPVFLHVLRPFADVDPYLLRDAILGLSMLLFLLTLWLLFRTYPGQRQTIAVLAVVAIAGFWQTLYNGQIYAPLIFAGAGAWLLLSRGRHWEAGLLLGLIIAFKPNLALVALMLLLAGHYRSGLSAAGVAAALSLVPLVLDGPGIYSQWLEAAARFPGLGWQTNASLPAYGPRLGVPHLGYALAACLTAASCYWCWRKRLNALDATTLGVLMALLAGPISWPGYTLFLLGPLLSRPWTPAVWSAVLLLAVPYFLFVGDPPPGPPAIVALSSVYTMGLLVFLVYTYNVIGKAETPEQVRERSTALPLAA